MASIFTPNIDTVTVAAGKVVCRDEGGNKTVVTGGNTIGMHKSDRKVMKAAGITN